MNSTTVERISGGSPRGLVALIGEAGVGDVAAESACRPLFTNDFADRYADATGPSEGAAIDPLGDDAQVMFGGGEQFVAFVGPLAGQGGVAAGDQPFP